MATPSSLAYTEHRGESQGAEREQLILEHLPQVRWIATRIHERLPSHTSLEDLISVGIVGLINAIDGFDPSYNVKLKTYAEHKIRGAILDSIRGMDGDCSAQTEADETDAGFDRETGADFAAPAGRGRDRRRSRGQPGRIPRIRCWSLRGVSIGSLDAPEREGSSRTLMHYLADPADNSPAQLLERSELEN